MKLSQAIKMDIIRSLMSRCELLCEEFDVTEEKQGSEVYDPPVRLFCQLPQSGVDVCDYVFQDEKQEEVKQRIQELLDIDVDELEESEKSAGERGGGGMFVFTFLIHFFFFIYQSSFCTVT